MLRKPHAPRGCIRANTVWTLPRSRPCPPRLHAAAYHANPFLPRRARTRRPHSPAANSSERAPRCTPFVSLFPAPPRAPTANSTCLTQSKRRRDLRASFPRSSEPPTPCARALAGGRMRIQRWGLCVVGMGTMYRGTTPTPPRSDIYAAGVAHLKFAARASCAVVRAEEKEEWGVAVPSVAHALL
jgi:hypothetical protein